MGGALLTDLYELNMAASYLRRDMRGQATFSLFIRELPRHWGFFVACGLEACLDFLEGLSFEEEDLDYLRGTGRFDGEALEAFRGLRFTGDVRAVPEGRVVFPGEPLLEVTAPLPEAQLVETALLNQITYQTTIASKAARVRLADPEADLLDFSFRRVHGVEASIAVARAMALVGFVATSNVEAGRRLALPVAGTMAHSYIESFRSETEAFRAFAEDFPEGVVLLVDTYDTERGVEKAIAIARELAAQGRSLAGIRLDSGDLGTLARKSRGMLDAAGLQDVRIFASGALDEHRVAELADEPIDAFGIGSKVGVAVDAPSLDSAYKLVEYDGHPVAKLSTGKATLPGRKQVWRPPGFGGDTMGLADESGPEGAEALLVQVMRGGERLDRSGLAAARERFARDMDALTPELRRREATATAPELTSNLRALDERVRAEIRDRELG